jgi:hypothetical protein
MSWDNVGSDSKQNNGGSDVAYCKLPVGTTTIRVVDKVPFTRWTHWIPQANGGKGVSIDCPGKGCIICADITANKKAKTKSKYNASKTHSINVYTKKRGSEEVNKIEVLEKGNGVFGGLKSILEIMKSMSLPEDITTVDISIIRTGEDFNQVSYNCIPLLPCTPLADNIAKLEKYDLMKLKPMLNNEQIQGLIDGLSLDQVVKPEEETNPSATVSTTSLDVDFSEEYRG